MKPLLMALVLAILALGMTPPAPAHAEQLPADITESLLAPDADRDAGQHPALTQGGSRLMAAVRFVQQQQRELYKRLAASVRLVKERATAATIFPLTLICFLFGIVHAAGPGHGKALISAFLIANVQALERGILLSFAAAFAQAAVAIALVASLAGVLRALNVTADGALGVMSMASGALIVAMGAWMTWTALRPRADARADAPAAADGAPAGNGPDAACIAPRSHALARHSCGHDHRFVCSPLPDEKSPYRSAIIVVAIGARPCSSAVFILLFANAIDVFPVGLWAVMAMSLGTALTVSALAALTLYSKRASIGLANLNMSWLDRLYRTLRVAGSAAVLCLGLFLLLSTATVQAAFLSP